MKTTKDLNENYKNLINDDKSVENPYNKTYGFMINVGNVINWIKSSVSFKSETVKRKDSRKEEENDLV